MEKINRLMFHLMISSISALILGLGCVFFVQASLGSDAMTTLMNGMEITLGCTLSQCNLIINIVMIILAFLIDHKQIGIGSVLYPIVSSQGISIGFMIVPIIDGYMQIIGYLCGIILLSLAIAIASKTNCGKNPYDALCFAIMSKRKVKYNLIRSMFDAFMLVIGIILGGTYGIGTLFGVLLIGTLAMYFMNLVNRWSWLISSLESKGEII